MQRQRNPQLLLLEVKRLGELTFDLKHLSDGLLARLAISAFESVSFLHAEKKNTMGKKTEKALRFPYRCSSNG